MSETEAARSEELPLLAVIGAAGLCGTHVLEAAKHAQVRVRAVVHSPAGRERVAALGADEIVEADLEEPDSVRSALKGAELVFMIPPPFHPEEDVLATSALKAAEQAGARKFVYLSVFHPHTPELHHHMRKANAEAAVHESNLDWTILQPSMFAQIVLSTWGQAPAGAVHVPFDVHHEFSLIDLRDLAEVGVKIAAEQGHDAATYELAGPSIALSEAIGLAGRARGVELEATTVDWAEATLPPGVAASPSQATDMRAMWQYYDRRGHRGNSNVLRMLLGREPASFEQAAAAFAARG
ncbi:NmrA family NAD(P)-binding protein [Streptomyces sp. NPDC097610]|uniref:SDR family oxidoreductase n=1 Tax=Streptomyces sp. NPDC097610 TaxID=3157227 RepID=UPI00331A5E07